jgi:hypothetical protein
MASIGQALVSEFVWRRVGWHPPVGRVTLSRALKAQPSRFASRPFGFDRCRGSPLRPQAIKIIVVRAVRALDTTTQHQRTIAEDAELLLDLKDLIPKKPRRRRSKNDDSG